MEKLQNILKYLQFNNSNSKISFELLACPFYYYLNKDENWWKNVIVTSLNEYFHFSFDDKLYDNLIVRGGIMQNTTTNEYYYSLLIAYEKLTACYKIMYTLQIKYNVVDTLNLMNDTTARKNPYIHRSPKVNFINKCISEDEIDDGEDLNNLDNSKYLKIFMLNGANYGSTFHTVTRENIPTDKYKVHLTVADLIDVIAYDITSIYEDIEEFKKLYDK